jgi:uncharacterized protein HemX
MADGDNPIDLEDLPEKKSSPVLGIILVVAVLGIAAVWVYHEKTLQRANDAIVKALDSEVTADEKALEGGRDRVIELTNRLETMKQEIESGQIKGKDKKKAVDDYNKLAADQRTERDKIKALADQYNAKVAKLRQLQQ